MSVRATSILLLVLSSYSLAAQVLDDFERVLIPGFASPEIIGRNGARFAATAALHAPVGTRVFPIYRVAADGQPVAETVTLERPTALVSLFLHTPPSRVGRFLFLDRAHFGEMVISAVLDSRAAGQTNGGRTRLPIVRESDFRSASFSIINVESIYDYEGEGCPKTAPRFRHTLRVYDFDGRGGAVRVQLVDEFSAGIPISEVTLDVASREGDDPSYPLYGEMEIPELCHPFSCRTPCAGGSQRVEITPLTPGMRVWAFVSETNNATQDVALLYPD